MGMKHPKRVVILLIFIISVSAIVVGALLFKNEDDSIVVRNQSGDTALTAEQYEFVVDSLLQTDHLNEIRFKNTWLILELMREIGFEEAGTHGHSRAGFATGILEFLDVGVLQEVEFVRIDREDEIYFNTLIMKVTNGEGRIYYLWFNQTGGLVMTTRGSEEGEMVYGRNTHMLHEGQLCEIDFENSVFKNCLDRPE